MDKKPWYKSLTLWGNGLTILSVVAPRYASVISPIVSEAGIIAGAITSILGRLRTKREVTFIPKEKT